jgi:hypothetical protein
MSTPTAAYQQSALESFAGFLNAGIKPFNELVKQPDGLQELIEFLAKGIFALFGDNAAVKACASFNRLSLTVDGTRTIRDLNGFFNSKDGKKTEEEKKIEEESKPKEEIGIGEEIALIAQRVSQVIASVSFFLADALAACAIFCELKVFDEESIFAKVAQTIGCNNILGHQLSFGLLATACVFVGFVNAVLDTAIALSYGREEERWDLLKLAAQVAKLGSYTLFFLGGTATMVAGLGATGAFLTFCHMWGKLDLKDSNAKTGDKKSNDLEGGNVTPRDSKNTGGAPYFATPLV